MTKQNHMIPNILETQDVSGLFTNKELRRIRDRREARFIMWDGEGCRDDTGRQSYCLLGNSTGAFIRARELRTDDMLAFIIEQGRLNPGAIHVGFAFDYDINMILRDLSPYMFNILKVHGAVIYRNYRIEHIPNKWITITQRGLNYDNDKKDKTTVRIADVFGFFQCSFVKACRSYIPNHPTMAWMETVEEGKAQRNAFTYNNIDYITNYWQHEIALAEALANELRSMLYDVGLNVTQWHGPGAVANYVFRSQGVRKHMGESPKEVHEAAKYAYAGGRFEVFEIGHFQGPIYSVDINSAYPSGIAQLPSLSAGEWVHTGPLESHDSAGNPLPLSGFGVYQIQMDRGLSIMGIRTPMPLFHRDSAHRVTFPPSLRGWYWTPEVFNLIETCPPQFYKILDSWTYAPATNELPFEFVREMYRERKRLKALGIGSERALKLALNSLYGKMAQRAGWQRSGKAPAWHQLEWAGWVTSYTRAMLHSAMIRVPRGQLIAVETDGIYMTYDPKLLGIENSPDLGGWEVTEYDEAYYFQSGVYFLRKGDTWVSKYRGLDKDTLTPETAIAFAKSLFPNPDKDNHWPTIDGPTTRFVGYRNALHRSRSGMGPFTIHHCKWERTEKHMSLNGAKRIHYRKACDACKAGANAYEMPHDTIVHTQADFVWERESHQHPIPWDGDIETDAEWRNMMETEEGLIRDDVT